VSVIRFLLVVVSLYVISDVAVATSNDPPQWALDFARSYEDAVNRRDLTAVANAIDAEALFQLAVANRQINQAELAELRQQWVGSRGLAIRIVQFLGDEGHCRLVRVRQRDGSWTALYRLVNDEGEFSYHDALLVRKADDSVGIVDFYIAFSGEWWSETFGRLFGLVTGGRADAEALALFNRLTRLYEEGRYDEVLDAWAMLPQQFHRDKGVHLVRVVAAMYVSDSEGAVAAEAYARQFPGDPSLDLVLMDARVLREQYAELEESIDRLRDAYGDHAWFDYQLAAVLKLDGRIEDAKALLEKSLEREPDLTEPRWVVIAIALEENDHQTVATQLEIIESLGIGIGDLTEVPEYSDYVTSEAYQQWMARRDYLREADEYEMQWIIESRLIGHGLFARYRADAVQDNDVLTMVDMLIERWLADESEDVPGSWIVTRGLAATIGDEVATTSGGKWIVAYTPQMDEYWVVGDLDDPRSSIDTVLDPFELVEQQLMNHQPGRIGQTIRQLQQQKQ
jgi:tetratricopeptide (TPR) repeat protein